VYAAAGLEGIFVSEDSGKIWTSLGTNFYSPTLERITAPLSMAVDQQNNLIVGTYGGGVYTYSNRRGEWSALGASVFLYYRHTIVFEVQGFNTCRNTTQRALDNFVYYITRYGDSVVYDPAPSGNLNYFRDTCIDTTTVTFTQQDIIVDTIYSRISSSWNRINTISIGQNGIYIGTDFGVFKQMTRIDSSRSTIAPDTIRYWLEVDYGTFDKFVLSLAVTSSGTLYAGTFGDGVFRSTDNGVNWDTVNSGISTISGARTCLAISPQGYLFFGSKNGSVYRSIQPVSSPLPIAPGSMAKSIPGAVLLEPNYPNPFNATTIIPFTLKKSGYTEVKIYNSLGQEVAKLLSKNLDEGRHEVAWNAAAYPSGIYFYRVQSAASIEIGRLALMK
jgi:hypothetical protein